MVNKVNSYMRSRIKIVIMLTVLVYWKEIKKLIDSHDNALFSGHTKGSPYSSS